jgi:predicted TIM-barrel fold metal-dependent hydrolase
MSPFGIILTMEDTKHGKHDDSALSGSRRSFLTGAATAAGIGTLFPALRSFAQTGNGPRRIDVHHHFTPPAYLEFTRANGQGGGGGRGAVGGPVAVGGPGTGVIGSAYRGWTLEEDMADMDKSGTQVALLSITTPGFWFGKVDEVRTVSRQCNEYAAKLRSDHPGRFGSFATIPLADTDGALKETEYALDTLKADGIGLYSNYRDKWLGDSAFDPVYQELNRRKAVIYVHPVEADCCRNIVKDVFDTVVEYGADTTRTIASLILSGSTTRFPDIKWIFSHAGGMMPFVIERFETGTTAEIVPGIVTKGQGTIPPKNVPKGVLYELRKMYYDTAQSTNPVAMRALKEVAGVSQIVYGTDYWYRSSEETARGLTTDKVFTAEELKMINRGNAERLLPKYHGT